MWNRVLNVQVLINGPQVYRTCRMWSRCRTTAKRWRLSGRRRPRRPPPRVTSRTWFRNVIMWARCTCRNAWAGGQRWLGRTGRGNSSDSCTRRDGGSSSAWPPSTKTEPAATRRRPNSFSWTSDSVSMGANMGGCGLEGLGPPSKISAKSHRFKSYTVYYTSVGLIARCCTSLCYNFKYFLDKFEV